MFQFLLIIIIIVIILAETYYTYVIGAHVLVVTQESCASEKNPHPYSIAFLPGKLFRNQLATHNFL